MNLGWEPLTLHLHLQEILPILNPMLSITAIQSRVVGAQLTQDQGGIRGRVRIEGQEDSVTVDFTDFDLQAPGHQDLGFFAVGKEGPFYSEGAPNPMATGRFSSGHWPQVGDVAGDGEAARQDSAHRRILGN